MPKIVVYGLDEMTESTKELELKVTSQVTSALGCPESWVSYAYPMDLFTTEGSADLLVLIYTGMLRGASDEAKTALTKAVADEVRAVLLLEEVECAVIHMDAVQVSK